MKRRGPSTEFSELRPCSGKKTVKSCKDKGNANKFVFIDLVDEDVIDIDYLESLQGQSRGSSTLRKDGKSKSCSFIFIDDDEGNYTSPVDDLDSDATSSKNSFPTSNYRRNSVTSDGDECQVVQEKSSALKGSKCKQTHRGKAPARNCYGLNFESQTETESGSSDSDYSDCELIEGSSGKLHEHWEKVSQKRKHVVHNGQSGSEDQVSGSASGSHSDTRANVEKRTAHGDVPVCSTSKNGNFEKENLPNFVRTGDGHVKSSSFDSKMDGSFVDLNQKVAEEDPLIYEWKSYQNDGMSGLWKEEEQSPEEPPLRSKEELGGKQTKHTGPCFRDNVQNFSDKTTFPDSLPVSNNDQRKASVSNGEKSFSEKQNSGPSDHERAELRGKDDEFHDSTYNCNPSLSKEYRKGTSFEEKEEAVFGRLFDENQMDFGFAPSEEKLGSVHEKACPHEKVRADFEEIPLCNTSCNGATSNQGGPESPKGEERCDLRDQLDAQDGSVILFQRDIATVERDIVNDREKLKETAEYKRALEEEMAARQKALQIQAEEAQRLRKRKKAESMRLLDMKRRQKERVEEVRETQKKDEENLNLKDELRAEIRKELKRLEVTCIDMASLLRSLGIEVGAGFRPLGPKEVHAAYKQALLKFHPDRASRTDIRQQVESEEKFKLISRMKEKLVY